MIDAISSIFTSSTTWVQAWQMHRFHSPLALTIFFLLGSVLGSFINVIIWRFPRKESIIRPRSHCLHCGTPLSARQNVPILSYFFLGGRSACCGQVIPIRYPIVEMSALMTLGSLYWLFGLSTAFLFYGVWMLLLILLAGIDIEHYRLPNLFVGFGMAFSLILQIFWPLQEWKLALWGMLVGLMWSGLTIMISRVLKGKISGMGDLKLAMVLGFAFGPGKFVLLYLIASVSALIYAGLNLKNIQDRRVPMGPFFAVGTWIAMIWGDDILRWYMKFLF